MGNPLQQGIAAAKAGNKEQAYQLLTQATQDVSTAGQAWIWLSSVVEHDSERLFCMEYALRINPGSDVAKRGAAMLRQKGVFPSPPVPPQTSAALPEIDPPAAALDQSSSRQGTPEADAKLQQFSGPELAQPSQPVSSPDDQAFKENLQALSQFVVVELTRNTPPHAIEAELVKRSLPPELAKQLVISTQNTLKKNRAEKYRKRMNRGALWTIAGLVVTCGSFFFASDLGGSYVLCWGAIIFGIIDFLVGLFGWFSNK